MIVQGVRNQRKITPHNARAKEASLLPQVIKTALKDMLNIIGIIKSVGA